MLNDAAANVMEAAAITKLQTKTHLALAKKRKRKYDAESELASKSIGYELKCALPLNVNIMPFPRAG